MKWWIPLGMLTAMAVGLTPAQASDLDRAPPAFEAAGLNVPVDIDSVMVHYVFDYAARKATGTAKVTFRMGNASGYPLFDMVPDAESLRLNGKELPPSAFAAVASPDRVTTFRVVRANVTAGSVNELDLTFDISSAVTFRGGAARVGFFMSDLSDRAFFEQYGPANMEYDRIKFAFTVEVRGTETPHALFANGDVRAMGSHAWSISYPDYFDSSSLYFHLSAKDAFVVKDFIYDGVASSFPVTIYADSSSNVTSAYTKTLETLTSLEDKLGPYAHDRLVIYVAGLGGMEYAGATMTSLWALPHELTHSWYARGVMPVNGNAGWIDEAIASWQDNDFRTASGAPARAAVNLGNFSPYRRSTTQAAYTEGEELIAELDFLFKSEGGMLPVVRDLFAEKRRSRMSVDEFHRFVERETGADLQAIFDRYVYGKVRNDLGEEMVVPERRVSLDEIGVRGHPRPYTPTELIEAR